MNGPQSKPRLTDPPPPLRWPLAATDVLNPLRAALLPMPTYTFRIARSGMAGVTREFKVELDQRNTVLDGLFKIQREHDASLGFRCSCRVGMCGTCAMVINWEPRLACQPRVEPLKSKTIVVEPLKNLPVVKDLIVSLEP